MPAQDGVRFDQERRPAVAAEHARQRGEQRTVCGFETRSRHLTVQNGELMPKDEDLGVLGTIGATAQHQQVDHEADKSVEAGHSLIFAA